MIDKLLNQYTYTLSSDGKPYTPKESFMQTYNELCLDGGVEKYYDDLVMEEIHTKEEVAKELETLRGYTDEETAFNIIENTLSILDGYTVEFEVSIRDTYLNKE